MSKYTYNDKQCKVSQLRREINASDIIIALGDITVTNNSVEIVFKADLSAEDESILNDLVEAHVPSISTSDEPESVKLSSPVTPEDGIPYIYATSRPIDHYVCFLGAGDSEDRIGGGEKCVYYLKSTDAHLSKDFTFNEDVYIKDGYMITKDAPMGSSIDIDIVHPLNGFVVGTFGREVPIFGTGWFPMDTEDRGFLPKGMIVRLTIHNSTGENGEDPPGSFYVAGRFETYRPKWGTNGSSPINR